MTIEEFLTLATTRLPTPEEMLALCGELGLRVGRDEAGELSLLPMVTARPLSRPPPVPRLPGHLETVALLASLVRREPWRSRLLELLTGSPMSETVCEMAKPEAGDTATVSGGEDTVALRPMECQWRWGHVAPHAFPEQGWPAGAGYWRFVGDEAWLPIPGRELARGEVATSPQTPAAAS